jgi:hypothetical protein
MANQSHVSSSRSVLLAEIQSTLTPSVSRLLCRLSIAIALVCSAELPFAQAHDEAPCEACANGSSWWGRLLTSRGYHPKCTCHRATTGPCNQLGPYSGYNPTCWQRWPEGWYDVCPPQDCENVPALPPAELLPPTSPGLPTTPNRSSSLRLKPGPPPVYIK